MGTSPACCPTYAICSRRSAGARGPVERGQFGAADPDRACVGELEPGEQVQERRLARAGGADDGVQTTRVECRVEAVQHDGAAVPLDEAGRLGDAVRVADRFGDRGLSDRSGLGRSRPAAGETSNPPSANVAVACEPIPARSSSSSGSRSQPPRPTTIVSLAASSRRPFLGDATVADAHDPVGDPRRLGIVTDDHRRAPVLADELREHVVHLVGGLAVELARRFVGEKHARAVREGRAERHPLLLASGELARACGGACPRGRPARAARLRAANSLVARACREGRAAARRARAPSAPARAHARSAGRRSRAASSDSGRAGAQAASRGRRRAPSPARPMGVRGPASSRSSVDLPEPLGPSTVTTSPSATRSDSPCSAAASPSGCRMDAEDVLQLDRVRHVSASAARCGARPRSDVAAPTSRAATRT